MTVLMYSFFCWSEYTASSRWFIVMNYIVHSVMYSYYACKALRYMTLSESKCLLKRNLVAPVLVDTHSCCNLPSSTDGACPAQSQW